MLLDVHMMLLVGIYHICITGPIWWSSSYH